MLGWPRIICVFGTMSEVYQLFIRPAQQRLTCKQGGKSNRSRTIGRGGQQLEQSQYQCGINVKKLSCKNVKNDMGILAKQFS